MGGAGVIGVPTETVDQQSADPDHGCALIVSDRSTFIVVIMPDMRPSIEAYDHAGICTKGLAIRTSRNRFHRFSTSPRVFHAFVHVCFGYFPIGGFRH